MKQYTLLSLVVLALLSGCGRNKKKEHYMSKNKEQIVAMKDDVNIPLANEEMKNFLLDENLDELIIADDFDASLDNQNTQAHLAHADIQDDFAWVEESADKDRQFKNIYFAFNSYEISADQEENLTYNIALAKRIVDEHILFGDKAHQPTIVIDGNSCHSAGGKAYNLVLSEQRARALQERFVAAGIPREFIKIIGHGSEVPALKDGERVTGNRQQQWLNRRDEVHIIFS